VFIASGTELTAEQAALRDEELVATNLNTAMCKLRLDMPTSSERLNRLSAVQPGSGSG